MKAYKIAVGLLILQFSIVIAGSIGFTGPLSGMTTTGLISTALTSPSTWISLGLPLLSIGVANQVFGLRTNLGALVFAAIFTTGNVPLSATLAQLEEVNLMNPTISLLIISMTNVVFLFAFVQLASSPAKGAY